MLACMYVAEVHTATVTDEIAVTRRCKGCRNDVRARVRAEATASAEAAFFVRREAARDRAVQRAHDDARREAETLARLAACPRCGRRENARLVGMAIWDGLMMFLGV